MANPILAVSRRTRRTPYSEMVEAAGVKGYTVYNHMLLPTAFRSVEEDYLHLLEHVQVWDVSCERQVELKGPDAFRLVQLMTPRDLTKAQIGQCLYVPLIDETGGMINDPVLLKLAEDRYWLSIADSDVLLWAKGLAVGLGLDVAVSEPEVYPLAVQGPKSDDLMAGVFGEAVREIRFFRFAKLDFNGHPLLIARSGWSKQGGFEIYLDRPELAAALWSALFAAGERFNVGPGCPNLIERVESGLLSFGNDMTYENNPLECGLEKYCHIDRPIEFLGKAAMQDVARKGIARQIRGLVFGGKPCPACVTPWPVESAGRKVGQATTAAFSPRWKANLAFAMIDKSHWEIGGKLDLRLPDGTIRQAIVTPLPFPPAAEIKLPKTGSAPRNRKSKAG